MDAHEGQYGFTRGPIWVCMSGLMESQVVSAQVISILLLFFVKHEIRRNIDLKLCRSNTY